jgi:hypothetical protein
MPSIFPAATVANWTNQDLILYHGTLDVHVTSIRAGINLNVAPTFRRLDFGHGFYTTTIQGQAREWARRLAQRHSAAPAVRPAVVSFILSRDSLVRLEAVWFVRGTKKAHDFWSLIRYCRGWGATHGRGTNAGWYDVVVGPVVASVGRQASIPNSDQVSFHTDRGAKLLRAGINGVMLFENGTWRAMP